MKTELIIELLGKDGYVCTLRQSPASDNTLNAGMRELACNKQVKWPLSRTLSITASISDDLGGRLVAASASSAITGNAHFLRGKIANFLRARAWIEAEKLQIKGLEIDSTDTLSRLVVDAINPRG